MAVDEGQIALLTEALEPVGHVTSRAMMGGRTLYLDGIVFAIFALDRLWFKADATSDAAWDAMGATRFTYTFKDGRMGSMNYRASPEEAFDDPDELRRLALLGLEAGRRAPAKKPRKARA